MAIECYHYFENNTLPRAAPPKNTPRIPARNTGQPLFSDKPPYSSVTWASYLAHVHNHSGIPNSLISHRRLDSAPSIFWRSVFVVLIVRNGTYRRLRSANSEIIARCGNFAGLSSKSAASYSRCHSGNCNGAAVIAQESFNVGFQLPGFEQIKRYVFPMHIFFDPFLQRLRNEILCRAET
jgi:hypothetical protein